MRNFSSDSVEVGSGLSFLKEEMRNFILTMLYRPIKNAAHSRFLRASYVAILRRVSKIGNLLQNRLLHRCYGGRGCHRLHSPLRISLYLYVRYVTACIPPCEYHHIYTDHMAPPAFPLANITTSILTIWHRPHFPLRILPNLY